jgi:hypothetical protein
VVSPAMGTTLAPCFGSKSSDSPTAAQIRSAALTPQHRANPNQRGGRPWSARACWPNSVTPKLEPGCSQRNRGKGGGSLQPANTFLAPASACNRDVVSIPERIAPKGPGKEF